MTAAEIASLCPKYKKRGQFYKCCCPAHEDRHESLSIWEADGWVHLKCHTGCDEKQVAKAIGLDNDDLRVPGAPEHTVYVYNGFTKKRIPRRDGSKTFDIKKLDPTAEPKEALYHPEHVDRAVLEGRTIYFVNGEKAANALMSVKEVATCTATGEGSILSQQHLPRFKDAKVVIVAQRDEPGKKWATRTYEVLTVAGAKASVVHSATPGEKDDAFDHLCAGFEVSEFVPAPELMVCRTEQEIMAEYGAIWLGNVKAEPVDWLWYPYIPQGRCCLMIGDGDVGKSYATSAIAAGITQGMLPDLGATIRGAVVILAAEDDAADTIVPRIVKLGGDPRLIYHHPDPFSFDPKGLRSVLKMVETCNARLLIIDPITSYLPPEVNMNVSNQVRPILGALVKIARVTNCPQIWIQHVTKDGTGKGKGRNPVADHHRGTGSEAIRNICRSQLGISWHPNVTGLRVVRHLKHNLSEEGKPFGFEFAHMPGQNERQFCWRWTLPEDREPIGKVYRGSSDDDEDPFAGEIPAEGFGF